MKGIHFVKKDIRKIVTLILLSIVFGVLGAVISGGNLSRVIKNTGNIDYLRYESDQLEYCNYDFDGTKYISTGADPQICINDIRKRVGYIEVTFAEPVKEDYFVLMFWTNSPGEKFSEEKVEISKINKGETVFSYKLQKYLYSLRIDIGDKEGIEINIDNVSFKKARFGETFFEEDNLSLLFERWKIFFALGVFIFIHLLWGPKEVFEKFFRYRWVVGLVILSFMVLNKYNGDSISMYDKYIQPGVGSAYMQPVLGEPRELRSDEWVVSTPTNMSTQYLDKMTQKYNPLLRGTNTVNGYRVRWYKIYDPVFLIEKVLERTVGFDYGYSFRWYGYIILAFLVNLELFYIITNRNKLISLTTTCMLIFSSFFTWWIYESIFMGLSAFLVCFYYYFDKEGIRSRILFALGTALAGANFILYLYPAWEVPLGYVALGIMIWIVYKFWDRIKSFKVRDYLMIVCAVIFCFTIVGSSLIDNREYAEAIQKTVYPGQRISCGGYSFDKLFSYIPATFFAYHNPENASEFGEIISLFPLSLVAAIYYLVKTRKKNVLVYVMLGLTMFFGVFTTVGFPETLAKLTLLSYSPSPRTLDCLAFVQLILVAAVFSDLKQEEKLDETRAFVVSLALAIVAVYFANRYIPNYLSLGVMLTFVFVLSLIFYGLIANLNEGMFEKTFLAIICLCLITGTTVRPILKGTDAINSKPVKAKINEITSRDKEGKWIAYGGGTVLPGFSIACGAKTINSVNTYPNMELWRLLDEQKQYDEIYNRYAHVVVVFEDEEDTSFELVQTDLMIINLSYKDVQKTGAKYILSMIPLEEDNEYFGLTELYQESGMYIYEINYM